MSWQTRIASFRGVAFHVTDTNESFGRRAVVHEYPQKDEPDTEDMGRKARSFNVEGFVAGITYEQTRDQLIEAAEKAGAGQLVHPYYGTRMVTVLDCKVTHSSDRGGMARFSFSFVEAGTNTEPSVAVDTSAQLSNVQTSALASVQQDFLDGFSLDGLPSWGVGDIQATLQNIISLDAISGLGGLVDAFQGQLGDLMRLPGDLAAGLFGLIAQLPNVQDLLDLPFLQAKKVAGLQSVGGVVKQQQSLVTVAVRRAALIQHAGIQAKADHATVSDVQAARQSIQQAFDDHDFARGNPRPSLELATQLRQVRTAALAHMSSLAVTLPRTYELQLIESVPALVLSYNVYGQLRQADIVKRNAVHHPGFMPAGVPLQLTTE